VVSTGAIGRAIDDRGAATRPREVSMSSTGVTHDATTGAPEPPTMDMRLEVVVVPVSDVDRAKGFYAGLGWRLDADFSVGDGFRVVQLTPPGSTCSIIFGAGITTGTPGSAQDLMLVVSDVVAARDELVGRGVDVSDVFHDEGGVFHHAGTTGRVFGPDPERRSYASFASFADPDGNGWVLQEITTRLPGR
jgi:catechol 2,3-dioxygenase-like lactoylglutathione lyase family enzyme